jgi:hypothetical protein
VADEPLDVALEPEERVHAAIMAHGRRVSGC